MYESEVLYDGSLGQDMMMLVTYGGEQFSTRYTRYNSHTPEFEAENAIEAIEAEARLKAMMMMK